MTPQELADRCDSTALMQPLPNDTDLLLREAARIIRTQEQELARMTEALAGIVDHARYAIDPVGRIPNVATKRKPTGSKGCGTVVYLVEDTENAPGRVMAVMADKEDAACFADPLPDNAEVRPRTLWYGQPTIRGYNR